MWQNYEPIDSQRLSRDIKFDTKNQNVSGIWELNIILRYSATTDHIESM